MSSLNSSSTPQPPAPQEPEPTVGELVSSALGDVSSLVRKEIDLAKAEVAFSVKNGGIAGALIGAAVFLLLIATVMLSMAFAYLLHFTGLDVAWCFLIVFGAYLLIAGLLIWIAVRKFKYVGPPKRAIEQAKETKDALTKRG
ncbi:MAG: phage holin family protein [Nocardioidaceae bacterium]